MAELSEAQQVRVHRRMAVGGGKFPTVDRYLCSSTHLSPQFACYVLDELTEPSIRAASPAGGIDLVALARHASLARTR
jgi:hypothetical protein